MKFAVTGGCAGGARLGALASEAGATLETPRAALPTSACAVPHVTRAVLERATPRPHLLLAPLSSCLHLEPGARAQGRGLAAFCGARPQDVWLMTPDDAAVETPEGHFRGDSVPLWTRHGKTLVDPDRYMLVMRVFRPDLLCALADTRAHPASGRKRLERAAQRSETSLAACLQHNNNNNNHNNSNLNMLGVVTGWGCESALSRSVDAVKRASSRLVGVLLAGLATPAAAARVAPEDLPNQIASVLDGLGGRLLRVAPGRWSPAGAVALVDAGCDVLDASVASRLADAGRALVFPLRPDTAQVDSDVILNLDDERYKLEMTPLVCGCACLACGSHTRAYVHHLRRTRELLAPVLLSLHNLHHYDAMFAEIRRSIADGTFAQYREHILSQHARWLRQYPDIDKSADTNTSTNASADTDKSTDADTNTGTDAQRN